MLSLLTDTNFNSNVHYEGCSPFYGLCSEFSYFAHILPLSCFKFRHATLFWGGAMRDEISIWS